MLVTSSSSATSQVVGYFFAAAALSQPRGSQVRQFTSMLVYWGTSPSGAPIRFASRIAAASGIHVTLGDTVEIVPEATLRELPADWDVPALVRARKQSVLSKAAARMRRSGVEPSTILLEGDTITAIVECVKRDRHNLVVTSAPFPEMPDAARETTLRLVHESPVPVLLARDLRRRNRMRILAAVDAATWPAGDSDNLNARIVRIALWVAQHLDAEVHVVHAWQPVAEGPMRWAGVSPEGVANYHDTGREDVLHDLTKTIRQHRGRIDADHFHVDIGDPRTVIPQYAADNAIDLIVIGTFARSGLSGRILGNSAHEIVDSSTSSMLIVPRAG
jgi:nucleotide-binding universal stress UspA family protein